ncbi:hypothetical protein KSP39_PZI002771 [Platanthera zijinensis]|uniref:Retrovirus-related Pol polyprotein from transposon TNT 1-94-like beta-barrel domain-containing protein n=1 Tax=Platanthera zijinensis TaxID=2320716 RepID=A0AAP0BZZ2_9ASPA
MEMEAPRNMKEVQRLMGWLAGLSRFLSKVEAIVDTSPTTTRARGGGKISTSTWGSEPRRILDRDKHSGRLVKCSVELDEFDLTFVPRVALKARADADFLADYTTEVEGAESQGWKAWEMFVDRASDKYSFGAGVVLTIPQGVKIEQAIDIRFPVNNNQAEYGAFNAGLRLTRELGIQYSGHTPTPWRISSTAEVVAADTWPPLEKIERKNPPVLIRETKIPMIKLEKFTATEFTDWKLNTQFGMKYLNVFYTVQSDRATVMGTEAETQWIADEDFCRDYLLNCLSSSLAKTYIKMKTAKEIWEALEEHFRQEEDLSKAHLVDKFHSFMFDEEKAILPQERTKAPQDGNQANMVSLAEPSDFVAMVGNAKASTEWFLDSGATCHVCNNADLMTGLTAVKESVTVANGETADVLKVGNVTLQLSSDSPVTQKQFGEFMKVVLKTIHFGLAMRVGECSTPAVPILAQPFLGEGASGQRVGKEIRVKGGERELSGRELFPISPIAPPSGEMKKKGVEFLFEIKQGPEEILVSYVDKFQEEVIQVQEAPGYTLIMTFTLGLRQGFFKMEPKWVQPLSFEELMEIAAKEIEGEATNPEFAKKLTRLSEAEAKEQGGSGQQEGKRRDEPRGQGF